MTAHESSHRTIAFAAPEAVLSSALLDTFTLAGLRIAASALPCAQYA